ncbi:hypothetical protein [Streptomyces sp. NPDC060194]|uniref:hypothetical protein n=1 Tax=Streptomyces sp. NPDC060194 TaxID=3347069 RepID=UPI003652B64E
MTDAWVRSAAAGDPGRPPLSDAAGPAHVWDTPDSTPSPVDTAHRAALWREFAHRPARR